MNRQMRLAAALACLASYAASASAGSLDELRATAGNADTVAPPPPSSTGGSLELEANDPVCRSMDDRIPAPAAEGVVLAPARSATVVILNENHFESAFPAHPALLRKIKEINPDVDCLYMELRPGNEPKSAAEVEAESDNNGFKKIFLAAFSLGIKIRFVDGDLDAPHVADDVYGNIQARNPDMAARIASSLQRGECKAGALIVGKNHDASIVAGRTMKPLQSILSDLNVPSFSVNLVDLAFVTTADGRENAYAFVPPGTAGIVRKPNPDDANYAGCLGAGKDFPAGTGFKNRRHGEFCATPIKIFKSGAWGSLCDFDATLFY